MQHNSMDGLVEGARDLAISDNLEHSFQNAVKDDADLKRMTLKEFSLLSEGNIDVFFIPLTRTNAVLKAKLLLLRNLHLEKYSAVDSQVPPTPAPNCDIERAFCEGYALGQRQNQSSAYDSDKTPSSFATSVKMRLGNYVRIFSNGAGPSFLSTEEAQKAHESLEGGRHEKHLIAFMSPIFESKLLPIFPPHYRLVNSEQYHWLPQSTGLKCHFLAPDQIFCPHYLIEYRDPYSNAPTPHGHFGAFASIGAKHSIGFIADAKKEITSSGEADLMKYLGILSAGVNHQVRGFVYDAQKCVLMKAANGSVSEIVTVSWTAHGSLEFIRNFLMIPKDEWHDALEAACCGLDVDIVDFSSPQTIPFSTNRKSAMLGCGAFGRVFLVRTKNNEERAMKLVLGDPNVSELRSEFEIISNYSKEKEITNCVAGVIPNAFWIGRIQIGGAEVKVAAYLMSVVGTSWGHAEEVTLNTARGMLEALSDVHCFCNTSHGDARFRNVIFHDDKFKWIDFRQSLPPSTYNFKKDMIELFKSLSLPPPEKSIDDHCHKTLNRLWPDHDHRARRTSARALLIESVWNAARASEKTTKVANQFDEGEGKLNHNEQA